MKDPRFLQEQISRCHQAREKVTGALNGVSPEQLNWKPAAEKWSIGQCLEHLVISDCAYFPVLKEITEGTHEMNFWENWNPLSGLFGKMLVSQVEEKTRKKLNTPKIFMPPELPVDGGIFERFYKHLDTLVEYMAICQRVDIDKIHISSPVSRVVTYSLRNAFLLLTQHLHRHIEQAIAITKMKAYPAG